MLLAELADIIDEAVFNIVDNVLTEDLATPPDPTDTGLKQQVFYQIKSHQYDSAILTSNLVLCTYRSIHTS